MPLDSKIRYWQDSSELDGLRPVLDPRDESGNKNVRINKTHQVALRKTFNRVCPETVPCLLDYGCGIGRNYNLLSGKCRRYIGIDISTGMLRRAKGERYLIDGRNLPFGEATFDLIFSFWVLQHVIEDGTLHHIFSEFKRCLKPGGMIIICERSSSESLSEAGRKKDFIKRRAPNSYLSMASKHGLGCSYIRPVFYSKRKYRKYLFENITTFLFANRGSLKRALKNGENIYVFKKA